MVTKRTETQPLPPLLVKPCTHAPLESRPSALNNAPAVSVARTRPRVLGVSRRFTRLDTETCRPPAGNACGATPGDDVSDGGASTIGADGWAGVAPPGAESVKGVSTQIEGSTAI